MSIYALAEQYQYKGTQNKDPLFFRNTYNSGMSLLGVFINQKETNIYIGDSIATARFYFRPETFEVRTTYDFEKYVHVLSREEIVQSYNEPLENNIQVFKTFHEKNRLAFLEEMNQPAPEDNEPDPEGADEVKPVSPPPNKETEGGIMDKKPTPTPTNEKKDTPEIAMNEIKKSNKNENVEDDGVEEQPSPDKPKKKKKKKPKTEESTTPVAENNSDDENLERKKKKKKKEAQQEAEGQRRQSDDED